MLKWSVTSRRNQDHPMECPKPSNSEANDGVTPRIQRKRRNSSAKRKRHSLPSKKVLEYEDNKENQFTSTPIKSLDDLNLIEVFRDVSNLSPKQRFETRHPAVRLESRKSLGNFQEDTSPATPPTTQKKLKKRRSFLTPFRDFQVKKRANQSSEFFKHFEGVDSHIGVMPDLPSCDCDQDTKNVTPKESSRKRIVDIYAPTLPTFTIDYSPSSMKTTHCLLTLNKGSPSRSTPLKGVLETATKDYPPFKRPRVDHVNDFLQQISFLTSPEEIGSTFYNSKCNKKAKISPLVKKFIDLGFSNKKNEKQSRKGINDSSFINDLSLSQIVDAILDETGDNYSDMFNKNSDNIIPREENELNETHEENMLNTEFEKNNTSFDSGFKSTATSEACHQFEDTFKCKCSNNNDMNISELACKTIINLDETFNERCVDRTIVRKRPASNFDQYSEMETKRLSLTRDYGDNNFALKRQKCVRRRKTVNEKCLNFDNAIEKNTNSPSTSQTQWSRGTNPVLYDNSFESSIVSDSDVAKITELHIHSSEEENRAMNTPVTSRGRLRKCLLFDSLKSLDGDVSNDMASENRSNHPAGQIELRITPVGDELIVNVLKASNITRTSKGPINSYVKVYLSDQSGEVNGNGKTSQRTAVQADSNKPIFNHVFKLGDCNKHERLHIDVWHRDRSARTSEFIGCTSFSVRDECQSEKYGVFQLLPLPAGRNQNIPITQNNILRTIEDKPSSEHQANMCDSHSTSIDEMISLEEFDNFQGNTNKAILSEQQKSADENLFLRYLELDPIEGPDAIPAATQRRATGIKNGRTPFTHTKRLMKCGKSGFGFSVVWTHPPRIERVEKGLPADRAGILPGDYLIFVDKHNVVMMPEIEILNLIRSYGNQLTLEIFRRNSTRNGSVPSVKRINSIGTVSSVALPTPTSFVPRRPSTVCSTNTTSMDCSRKKLQLPQVTFSSEKASNNPEENRKRTMYQLINKEQQYATGLQFAVTRFVSALAERNDLITPSEHKILFQNSEEILRITEDIIDNLVQEDGELRINALCRTYHSKTKELCSAYKRYCSGIKKADCVLANKSRNSSSDFCRFLHKPEIPRRRPDITTFIHKPLEHFREILKLLTVIQSLTKYTHEDFTVINQIVQEMQVTYKEITSEAGWMEPTGGGRPLLTVQDLENRLVFTKCKPFILNKPGRQWIFGSDLSRIEGRNVRQYWTLLFSDLLLFAKVSRDRVLFITEDPLPLAHVTDMLFNVRKKETEFRISVSPEGRSAVSPTIHCGPDLSRTPKKGASKKTVILRAPTVELKAVWQNLLQRQILYINAGMEGSSLSSPLESPDVPITSSVVTLQSAESLSLRQQTPHNLNQNSNSEIDRQIDALIEHKCKQISKSNNSSKGNAIHLEKWMKGHLDAGSTVTDLEPMGEEWTPERLRKRSEELHLIDCQGNVICRNKESKKVDVIAEENHVSDTERSPSKSTSESQVTVRSSPILPESLPVCRQCHKSCLTVNGRSSNDNSNLSLKTVNKTEDDEWGSLFLMGLSAINPAASLLQVDPFVPNGKTNEFIDNKNKHPQNNCCNTLLQNDGKQEVKSYESTPDDSPLSEEHPYHSLSSSNLTIRRFGTVPSLEVLGTEDEHSEKGDSSETDDEESLRGLENEGYNSPSELTWTAKAGMFMAEKMAFLEKLGEDYRASGGFFQRYLKSSENHINGEEVQEEETSGGTSGEEIWGTPTSGGEFDDMMNSPTYEGKQSPNDGSLSSEYNDDTELMMDELLMTPPITGAIIRGLLPRRTLEPLIEEDISDTNSSSSSVTPTEPSSSSGQDSGAGNVADTCFGAAESREISTEKPSVPSDVHQVQVLPCIPRSPSYRKIVEAAEEEIVEDSMSFFNRFRPTARFGGIEKVPKSRSVRIFQFFNVRKLERRIHEANPDEKELIRYFNESTLDNIAGSLYQNATNSPKKPKDKQMDRIDRRFWKQLSKRRGNKPNSTE
ncbi:uncharacterized protein LOC123315465 [Coccinella septempunctata]|uniref:uncharacterized protein LOC123315465 n=1 Tax=Coccinella septempunctata TaxID=41139 RepID=UPI001D085890|nr:uncharacterized protein LOC123315465 [Coccinella septempunctata]